MRINKAHYEGDESTKQTHMRAWEAQQRVIFTAEDQWQHVCGPASSVMARLRGINWNPRADYAWEADTGDIVDLFNHIPCYVRHLRNEAVTGRL